MARKVEHVVVHCADTPNGKHFTTKDIDDWHRQRGFLRKPEWRGKLNPLLSSIGYHYVIYTDGTLHTGRHLEEVGAHVAGHNSRSVGICLIGRDKFTPAQWARLSDILTQLKVAYPTALVVGHCHFKESGKTCPNFDVTGWQLAQTENATGHVFA